MSKIEMKKEKVCQNNNSGTGTVVCGVENESGKIDRDSLEWFKDKNLGLRHASFKLSAREGITNAMRMNFQRKTQLWFELLKGANAEDEVEREGEKGTIKQVLHKAEVSQRRIFVGIEKGIGKHKNDLLVTMSKDCVDIGGEWISKNHGQSLKFVQDEPCESSMPMKSDENLKSINDVEEHTTKELKKKTETSSAWFKNNEEKKHAKKAHGHGGKEKKSAFEKRRQSSEKHGQSSNNESKRCDESSEE